MTKAPKPLVCVIWDDAHGEATGDYSEAEIERDYHAAVRYYSYGMLVRDDEKGVTIASEWSENAGISYRGLSFIPRGMVVSVEKRAPRKHKHQTEPT